MIRPSGKLRGRGALLGRALFVAGWNPETAPLPWPDRADLEGHRTYGLYRLEILAALANAALLFGVAGYVLFEAADRFDDPPEVLSGPMLVVAVLGLVVNLIGWQLLREGASESINVQGAFLEVVADLIGSIGVT